MGVVKMMMMMMRRRRTSDKCYIIESWNVYQDWFRSTTTMDHNIFLLRPCCLSFLWTTLPSMKGWTLYVTVDDVQSESFGCSWGVRKTEETCQSGMNRIGRTWTGCPCFKTLLKPWNLTLSISNTIPVTVGVRSDLHGEQAECQWVWKRRSGKKVAGRVMISMMSFAAWSV